MFGLTFQDATRPATKPTAKWFNAIQGILASVMTAAGLTPYADFATAESDAYAMLKTALGGGAWASDWVPTITATASGTISATTLLFARYKKIPAQKLVHVSFQFVTHIAGSGGGNLTRIRLTLPNVGIKSASLSGLFVPPVSYSSVDTATQGFCVASLQDPAALDIDHVPNTGAGALVIGGFATLELT